MKLLALALLVAIAAAVLRLGLLVYAAYVACALIALSKLFSRAWAHNIEASRNEVPLKHEIGDKFNMEVTLTNHSGLSAPWLLAEDYVAQNDFTSRPQRIKLRGETRGILSLKKNSEQTLTYEVELLRRGCYQFGPLLLETGDLFGLQRDFRLLTKPAIVTVYPKLLPLHGYDIQSNRPMGEIRLTNRLFDDPTRVQGIKPHVPGEPLNRIHWRATARTGQLQSKVYESTSVAGATIVLDFSKSAFPPPGEYYGSELAIQLAAAIAEALTQLNEQVGLATNGVDALERLKHSTADLSFRSRTVAQHKLRENIAKPIPQPVLVPTRRDVEQFERILDQLARLELSDDFPYAELLAQAAPHFARSATVLAVLGNVTEETALALASLEQRGFCVTALVISAGERGNPRWATAPEWAAHLLERDIPYRWVPDETTVQSICTPEGLSNLSARA